MPGRASGGLRQRASTPSSPITRPSLRLHAGHIARHRDHRPVVTLALVTSADDHLVGNPAGPAAAWIDQLRLRADAILVGAATARRLDPSLTVTIPGLEARSPLRVVLAGTTGIDRKLNLIGGFSGHRTAIIAETDAAFDTPASVEVLRVPGTAGRPDLTAALRALADKGIQNLLVEPGPSLANAFLDAGLVDAVALVITSAATDGPPATADGNLANRLQAAGLLADDRRSPLQATPSPSIGALHSRHQAWCIDVLGRRDYGDVLPRYHQPGTNRVTIHG